MANEGVVTALLVLGVMITIGLILQTNFDSAFGSTFVVNGTYTSTYNNLTANLGNAFLLMTILPILLGAGAVIAYVTGFGRM